MHLYTGELLYLSIYVHLAQWQITLELLYRQFRSIMPCFNDSSSYFSDANKLVERRKDEKEKFDARYQCELKPLVIGSTVSFLNSDLKTCSMGIIQGRSSYNRSYEILTENGLIISRNRVHLRETNVVFREQVMHARMLNLSWFQSHHQFPKSLQLLILMSQSYQNPYWFQ